MADTPTPSNPTDTAQLSKEKKRTRVQFSCTACRSRELKCCRTHPCTNCLKRAEASSCTFVGRGPRGRSSPAHVQDRLQHLENLILSLHQRKRREEDRTTSPVQSQDQEQGQDGSVLLTQSLMQQQQQQQVDLGSDRQQSMLPTPPSPTGLGGKDSPADQPGKLVVKDAGTSYIDSVHLKAILEEINEFKASLQDSELSDEETTEDGQPNENSPTILFGLSKPASKEELLADIPSRLVTDRLVSQFLNCKEPLVIILHVPTFQKEYNMFWSKPQDVSLPWLGMLYAIITLGVLFQQRGGDIPQRNFGEPGDIMHVFRKRSAQCLAQSNYTLGGRYKVEGLFLYTMCEFHRSQDAQVGVSFLFQITIKLAMRMGYHRDPQQFPVISAFHGEMRRRMWAFICQFDALLSFEVGVPRTIQDWQYDTELPRNLADEDYNENIVHLPPSRPANQITVTSYTIAKSRMMAVFGKILDMAFSRAPVTYEETLGIDRQLEEAHGLVPAVYHIRPMDQCIADPPDLIFQRYRLENTYQKARCVLHRRYLGEMDTNLRYAYSRVVCISASKQILRCHAEIYRESQPGGLMYQNRHVHNSIQFTDYLLAAMILCMELSYSHAKTNDVAVVLKDQDDLLSTLEKSHQFLDDVRHRSADAQKAYAALTIMLRRVKKGLHTISPPKSSVSGSMASSQVAETPNAQPPPYGNWADLENLENPLYQLDPSAGLVQDPKTFINTPYASLEVIEEMLDAPANNNWQLWDRQIQGRQDPVNSNDWWYLQ